MKLSQIRSGPYRVIIWIIVDSVLCLQVYVMCIRFICKFTRWLGVHFKDQNTQTVKVNDKLIW